MLEDLIINFGVSALLTAIKNPQKKKDLRKVFLKVFTVIWQAFASDPDFQAVVKP
jgi:hypothetical protein